MKPGDRDFVDYSHEVNEFNSPLVRYILITLSFIFLLLGFIGVFLPLLPTTPFVLLSAFLYARSSKRFYNWMMNHPQMGPPLRQWKKNRSIPRKAKILAVTMLGLTIVPSSIFLVPIPAVKIGLLCLGLTIALYIISRPDS